MGGGLFLCVLPSWYGENGNQPTAQAGMLQQRVARVTFIGKTALFSGSWPGADQPKNNTFSEVINLRRIEKYCQQGATFPWFLSYLVEGYSELPIWKYIPIYKYLRSIEQPFSELRSIWIEKIWKIIVKILKNGFAKPHDLPLYKWEDVNFHTACKRWSQDMIGRDEKKYW